MKIKHLTNCLNVVSPILRQRLKKHIDVLQIEIIEHDGDSHILIKSSDAEIRAIFDCHGHLKDLQCTEA